MRARVPLFLAVLLLAACGSSSSSSSDPGSADYDPAHTTLKKAGLEVCGEASQDMPPTLTSLPGLGSTRAFSVAKDCNGAKTTPNKVFVLQFTSTQSANHGETAVKAALPNAAVAQHYPLVIATTGPSKDANLAAIQAQLPPSAVTTT